MLSGGGIVEKENEKITLPKSLQIQMIKFFLKTSIPRNKKNSVNGTPLSKKEEETKK